MLEKEKCGCGKTTLIQRMRANRGSFFKIKYWIRHDVGCILVE